MNEHGHVYVIDNNALSFLGRKHRGSDFFMQYCRIPSEVLHEAEGFPDIEELKELEYPVTANVLTLLIEVMASVPASDRALVNLYANLGNADPLVVATALDGQRTEEAKLFGPTWIVVSGDKAVLEKAQEFGLAVRNNEEFKTIIESHGIDSDEQ